MILKSDIEIGRRVRSLYPLNGVPDGTEGVIDERYSITEGTQGFMVAWDLPDNPLPEGYREHDGRPAIQTRILRDGFDVDTELYLLQCV